MHLTEAQKKLREEILEKRKLDQEESEKRTIAMRLENSNSPEYLRKAANVKKRYVLANKDYFNCNQDIKISPYIEGMKDFILKGKGLYIYGPNGTGKTYGASVLIKKAISLGVRSFWVTSFEIREAFFYRQEFLWDESAGISMYYRMNEDSILVIDDLGKEYKGMSGYVETCIRTLVRARYDDLKSTIITSNLTPPEVEEQYGKSFASMIGDYLIPIDLHGDDLRK